PEPVVSPHFGYVCLHYDYRLEERVARRVKRGNDYVTEYSWETRDHRTESAPFCLRQNDLSILVDGRQAEYLFPVSETNQMGSWRHSVNYVSADGEVSVVGSVSEGRERLEPYGNIPLAVSPLERAECVRQLERGEKVSRGMGYSLFWIGSGVSLSFLFTGLRIPSGSIPGEFNVPATILGFSLATLGLLGFWCLYTYNSLVVYRTRIENAWRHIDIDLKMRYDLIPNLVECVQGYLSHERALLERLTELRGQALQGDVSQKIQVEAPLTGAIEKMQATIEAYPDLKAQPVVERLMRELSALEEKIAHGRDIYCEAVTEYNTSTQSFPIILIARCFGFRECPLFQAAKDDRALPQT
ncbi:MAG TPA: LemA family protein, partial [Candidatus Sumerlaeota bacterium]|nr:LemA family protein [Candidatus Sumerlaeota bacterium]